MTLLEIMIVLAVIAGGMFLVRTGFRMIAKNAIVEDATDLMMMMRTANRLAIQHGEVHRVRFDLDHSVYTLEVCEGALAVARNEELNPDSEKKKDAIQKGKDKMQNLPADAFAAGDPEEATKRAAAIGGAHVMDRTCGPPTDALTGDEVADSGSDPRKRPYTRTLSTDVRFKLIAVQHQDDPITKGQTAIYFFPMGSSEKAVVELSVGSDFDAEANSLVVYGLTSRVELRDGEVKNLDDVMLRNLTGDKDAKRETDK